MAKGIKKLAISPEASEEEIAEQKAKRRKRRNDIWIIVLMIVASGLCLGIIGVLIYWLEVFLN